MTAAESSILLSVNLELFQYSIQNLVLFAENIFRVLSFSRRYSSSKAQDGAIKVLL